MIERSSPCSSSVSSWRSPRESPPRARRASSPSARRPAPSRSRAGGARRARGRRRTPSLWSIATRSAAVRACFAQPPVSRQDDRPQVAVAHAEDREVDGVLDLDAHEHPRLLVRPGEPHLRPLARRRCVTSRPRARPSRRGPMSPEMTLKSVVLPAPFGRIAARRSPSATSSVTSRTACRPPKRRPTPASGGSARHSSSVVQRSLAYLITEFVTLPFLTTLILPCHGSFLLTQGGNAPARRGLVGPERAAERLVDVRHVAGHGDAERP